MSDNMEMVWTIGLRDKASVEMERLAALAERLQKRYEAAFKGVSDWRDVADTALAVLGKSFDRLGMSEEKSSKALDAIGQAFERFVNNAAPTKDTMVAIAETLRDAGVSGENFVKCIAPMATAMKSVWEPTDAAAACFEKFKANLDKLGVPCELYKKELEKVEHQLDEFTRSGKGANELLEDTKRLLDDIGIAEDKIGGMLDPVKSLVGGLSGGKMSAEEIEKLRRASDEAQKNYLRGIAHRNREVAQSTRGVINAYTGLLNVFGLLPPGASRVIYTISRLNSVLEMSGRRAGSLSGLAEALTTKVGYSGRSVNVLTLGLQKLGGAIKAAFTAGGGLGGVAVAGLAAVVGAVVLAQKKLDEAIAELSKSWERMADVARKHTKALADETQKEAKAAQDAAERIRDEADAYEELAQAKETAAKAKSDSVVAGMENDLAEWKRANGDATPEATAEAEAMTAYAVEQERAAQLEREQAAARDRERRKASERERQRSLDESEYDRILAEEEEAERLVREWQENRPDRIDIKTENLPGVFQEYRYEDEEAFLKAQKEYNAVLKERKQLVESLRDQRHAVEKRLPQYNDAAARRDEAREQRDAASERARQTALERQNEAVAAREEALSIASYRADTAAWTRWYGDASKIAKLEASADTARTSRKYAEERLDGTDDPRERALMQFAVKERKVAEEVAAERLRLEKERMEWLASTNDSAERERINAEYDYQRTWSDLLAERRREEIANAKTVYEQRVADARKAHQEEMASLREQAGAAQSRLAAAQQQVATAWGWYRDKDSLRSQIAEWEADAAARKQYAKDYRSLTSGVRSEQYSEARHLQRMGHYDELEDRIGEWRRKKMLSVDEEATMRVALAKDEERQAQKALDEINEAAQRTADALEAIQSTIEQGGGE